MSRLLTFNERTNLYSLNSRERIIWPHTRHANPGGPYKVTVVNIPFEPVHHQGGHFYKLQEGPDTGWLVDNDTNYFGYGDITVVIVPSGTPEDDYTPPSNTIYPTIDPLADWRILIKGVGGMADTALLYAGNYSFLSAEGAADNSRSWHYHANATPQVHLAHGTVPWALQAEVSGIGTNPNDRVFTTWRYRAGASAARLRGTLHATAGAYRGPTGDGPYQPGAVFTYSWELRRGSWGSGTPTYDSAPYEVVASGNIVGNQISTDGYLQRYGDYALDVSIPVVAGTDLQLYLALSVSPTPVGEDPVVELTLASTQLDWMGPEPTIKTQTLLTVNATTNRYSRTSAGLISPTYPRLTIPAGGPYKVTPVVVPDDPIWNTGGSFWRMVDGPYPGWLISKWTNELGYGNITISADATASRGPGSVIATLYRPNAHLAGFSISHNTPGELHFTLLCDDPNIDVVLPKQTHATVEFWIGDPSASEAVRRASYAATDWEEVWAGMIWDQDATDTETVFYGVDYLGLLQYCVDERFNPDFPEKTPPGGSFYKNQTIKQIVDSQLDYAIALPNSVVGFITRGATAAMDEKVTIPATMTQTLPFVVGLIDSHRAGTGKNTRLSVQKTAAGGYEFVIVDNPGVNQDGKAIRYGDLAQGYHVIQFGAGWASRVNLIARSREGSSLTYKSDSSGIDQAEWGRIAQEPQIITLIDKNDLARRALQAALDASRMGRQISVGLKLGSFRPLDDYDICDNLPIEINHGSVTTKDWASDVFGTDDPSDSSEVTANYWSILGLTWESFDDGHWMTNLTLVPKGGGRSLVTDPCENPTPDGHYRPNRGGTSQADGLITYSRPGVAYPVVPTPNFAGAWHFPTYNVADASVPSGTVDRASGDVSNSARLFAIGPGTMSIYLRVGTNPANYADVRLKHRLADGNEVTDWQQLGVYGSTGTAPTLTVTVPDDGYCTHWVELSFGASGNTIGFGGFDWARYVDPILTSDPATPPLPSSTGWGPPDETTTSDEYTDLATGITYKRNDDTETYDVVPGTGSVIDFTFTASTQWVINHTMGGYPRVTLRDTGGVVIDAEVVYTSTTVITINLSSAVAGSAHLG